MVQGLTGRQPTRVARGRLLDERGERHGLPDVEGVVGGGAVGGESDGDAEFVQGAHRGGVGPGEPEVAAGRGGDGDTARCVAEQGQVVVQDPGAVRDEDVRAEDPGALQDPDGRDAVPG